MNDSQTQQTVPAPTVVGATITPPQRWGDKAKVTAKMSDGTDGLLFEYFSDEISFTPEELVGLTVKQVCDLVNRKDLAYLQS
jgi:hypothetical protein